MRIDPDCRPESLPGRTRETSPLTVEFDDWILHFRDAGCDLAAAAKVYEKSPVGLIHQVDALCSPGASGGHLSSVLRGMVAGFHSAAQGHRRIVGVSAIPHKEPDDALVDQSESKFGEIRKRERRLIWRNRKSPAALLPKPDSGPIHKEKISIDVGSSSTAGDEGRGTAVLDGGWNPYQEEPLGTATWHIEGSQESPWAHTKHACSIIRSSSRTSLDPVGDPLGHAARLRDLVSRMVTSTADLPQRVAEIDETRRAQLTCAPSYETKPVTSAIPYHAVHSPPPYVSIDHGDVILT
ncbi:hypothetical protein MBM_08339 [Drepanopeziza brunnea f. sp. 'multigermtubi' MB_m1]|uniref:Uncharacterized protein n=1 Tax=Marssonina brunnea f. sp. multigermtubi (strain MB_m1) TaxID=1072389 RepID=K1WLB3_MARBU|nr:uncharacterized protein MBM_08339 [Drepanopeziza brunnea f. sp. 'multigermtubi' MB_m1]EKD13621.1 hypothetical protein MBM_08339 [Drepanopeziza brunnea f. sp. 'multigermtubi' MB_m1]